MVICKMTISARTTYWVAANAALKAPLYLSLIDTNEKSATVVSQLEFDANCVELR